MTAEEIIRNNGIRHDNTWDGLYYSHDSVIEAMQEYARLQIEKDREKIKKKCPGLVRAIIATIPIILD